MNASETEFDNGASEFQEEWLSAYLDDELSHHQRAIVEDRLATDETVQGLLEDLQRIRGLVSELPNWDRPTVASPLIDAPAGHDAGLGDVSLDDVDATPSLATDLNATEETTELVEKTELAVEAEVAKETGPTKEVEQTQVTEQAKEVELEQTARVDGVAEVEEVVQRESQESMELVLPPSRGSKQNRGRFGWWRPAALAASVLAMSGLGYMLWVGDSRHKLATSTQTTAEPEARPAGGSASMSVDRVEAADNTSAPDPQAARSMKERETAGIGADMKDAERSPKADNAQSLGFAPAPNEPSEALRMRRGIGGGLGQVESPSEQAKSSTEEPSTKKNSIAGSVQELELLPERTGDQRSSQRSNVYFARSAAWTDSEAGQAIAASSTLLGRRFALSETMNRNSRQAQEGRSADRSNLTSRSPVAIARLHGSAAETFSALISDSHGLNELNLNQSAGQKAPEIGAPSRSLGRSDTGTAAKPFGVWSAMGAADGNEPKSQESLDAADKPNSNSDVTSATRTDIGDHAVGELPPPTTSDLQLREPPKQEIGSALERSNSSYDNSSESIVLLISRSEAEAILRSPALNSKVESRSASLLWITPISRTSAAQPTDKVILILNPRAN